MIVKRQFLIIKKISLIIIEDIVEVKTILSIYRLIKLLLYI